MKSQFIPSISTDASASSSSPVITLRKGKVELKVKNAAAIIKRINEMFPKGPNYLKDNTDNIVQENRLWAKSAKEWFSKEVFGDIGDFEVYVDNGNTGFSSVDESVPAPRYDSDTDIFETPLGKTTAECISAIKKSDESFAKAARSLSDGLEKPVAPSSNKNAYEIRLDVLKSAINWLSLDPNMPKEYNQQNVQTPKDFMNGDAVVELANKFYKFVENRR